MVFAGITYLTAVGMILFAVLDILERWAIPWHVSHRQLLEPTIEAKP
jgi:NitT/TauT family transport system permease protein